MVSFRAAADPGGPGRFGSFIRRGTRSAVWFDRSFVLGPDFEKLFEAISSPYMVLDRDLDYVAVNAEYERVTMRPAEAYLGRHVFDMFPNEGESGRRLKASFARVLASGETDTLAYLPYDIPRPDEQGGGFDRRFWSCVHTPLLDEDGDVAFIVQNTVDVTEIVHLKEATALPFRMRSEEAQLIERAQQADRMREETLSQSADFRRMFQQAPGFFAVLSGPEHTFTFANDAYQRLIGNRPLIGRSVVEALPEIRGQGFEELLDAVFETGRPAGGEAMRVMLRQQPDEPPRETFLDFSYDAIRDANGDITGVFVQGMDRTESVRAQQRQKLLLDELNHRVKNTLATVQSIVSQTLRSAQDPRSARRDIEARLSALSKAHNLLSAGNWARTELGQLISQELSHYPKERVAAGGQEVVLTPRMAISVAMVIHELSTNAAKYGALSAPEGRVRLDWTVDPTGAIVLSWQESGGPPVNPPGRRGFGSRMIERVMRGELGGQVEIDYGAAGLSCRLEIPQRIGSHVEESA